MCVVTAILNVFIVVCNLFCCRAHCHWQWRGRSPYLPLLSSLSRVGKQIMSSLKRLRNGSEFATCILPVPAIMSKCPPLRVPPGPWHPLASTPIIETVSWGRREFKSRSSLTHIVTLIPFLPNMSQSTVHRFDVRYIIRCVDAEPLASIVEAVECWPTLCRAQDKWLQHKDPYTLTLSTSKKVGVHDCSPPLHPPSRLTL